MTTNQPIPETLPDMQNSEDLREIPIDRVGVTNLKYPIAVKDREKEIQHTIATIAMTVDLPMEFKGTHMSRFVEILECSTKGNSRKQDIPYSRENAGKIELEYGTFGNKIPVL